MNLPVLRALDPSHDADYQDDCEQYRRNLGRAIEYAQAYARTGGSAGAGLRDHAALARAAVSAGSFRELDAAQLGRCLESGLLGPNIGRNEHDVYVDRARGRAIKLTRTGTFGIQSRVGDYLRRLELNNRFLDDDLRFEGVLFGPSTGDVRLVVSQPFIVGRPATRAEITAYFTAKGFERYTDRSWWHGGHEILFSDAEGHNVLMGDDGLVYPIDLIPQSDLLPTRIQQIERGVEGWKKIQQDTLE